MCGPRPLRTQHTSASNLNNRPSSVHLADSQHQRFRCRQLFMSLVIFYLYVIRLVCERINTPIRYQPEINLLFKVFTYFKCFFFWSSPNEKTKVLRDLDNTTWHEKVSNGIITHTLAVAILPLKNGEKTLSWKWVQCHRPRGPKRGLVLCIFHLCVFLYPLGGAGNAVVGSLFSLGTWKYWPTPQN